MKTHGFENARGLQAHPSRPDHHLRQEHHHDHASPTTSEPRSCRPSCSPRTSAVSRSARWRSTMTCAVRPSPRSWPSTASVHRRPAGTRSWRTSVPILGCPSTTCSLRLDLSKSSVSRYLRGAPEHRLVVSRKTSPAQKYSDAQMADALRYAFRKLDDRSKGLSRKRYRELMAVADDRGRHPDPPAAPTFIRRYGTWSNACRVAGVTAAKARRDNYVQEFSERRHRVRGRRVREHHRSGHVPRLRSVGSGARSTIGCAPRPAARGLGQGEDPGHPAVRGRRRLTIAEKPRPAPSGGAFVDHRS